MDTTSLENKAQQAVHDADVYVRENPIPAVLCALGIGFAIGLLVRALDRPTAKDIFDERMDEAGGYLSSVFSPIAHKTQRAYRKSAHAVHDAVESARDIDVEDYTDPVVKWFRRMWKRCCG